MSNAIEDKVISVIELVFRNKNLTPPPLTAATKLDATLGLESLDFAEIVVRLEEVLGKDPFSTGQAPTNISTIGDLSALYV